MLTIKHDEKGKIEQLPKMFIISTCRNNVALFATSKDIIK